MIERISKLADLVKEGKVFFEATKTEYDREDLFLPPLIMSAKRSKEYILNQEPIINELTALTGYLRFEGEVMGDIFNRNGHKNFHEAFDKFYNKPIDGFATFEWQHSVADFNKVIRIGIEGIKEDIANSKENHFNKEETEFLEACDIVADAVIGWADKCSCRAYEKAQTIENEEVKKNLIKLSEAIKNVPKKPAKSFYEAVLSVFVIYAFVPDSIGTIDRYLYPFYVEDKAKGILSDEEAKTYLQELFLMLQSRISIESDRFYRGGESHFCIGGYLENGEDGFNELSKLVLDAMLELPTWIPQISLRWTKKTPKEVLKYVMNAERNDPNKRIAFVSDEPRIRTLTEFAGLPYNIACNYTMVGCNEPQLPGGVFMGGCDVNIVKAMESTIYNRKIDTAQIDNFEDFYSIFDEELTKALTKAVDYYEKFQSLRARDTNLVSTIFYDGSIERAKSITQGGAKYALANISVFGIVTVIDSLTVIKQFVFDEKTVTMGDLINALEENWSGYENLHSVILKKCEYFGNDSDVSAYCAKKFSESLTKFFKNRKSKFGYPFLTGNLIGYNQHNKFFGDATKATPDGRYDKDIISFGIGQSEGRDREGLTALLKSVVKINEYDIYCGSTVTNVLLDDAVVKNDDSFDKLCEIMETYFKLGGLHYQLTYVSKEDLLNAKKNPEKYRSLRVRVSGFSDYFTLLNDDLQDEIILRTEHIS